jgi:hypothetical protein
MRVFKKYLSLKSFKISEKRKESVRGSNFLRRSSARCVSEPNYFEVDKAQEG